MCIWVEGRSLTKVSIWTIPPSLDNANTAGLKQTQRLLKDVMLSLKTLSDFCLQVCLQSIQDDTPEVYT